MEQPAFKGTLLLLQNQTKKDPESYYEEFTAQRDHFDAMVCAIEAGMSGGAGSTTVGSVSNTFSNPQFLAVMNYVCHVSHCYPKECEVLGKQLVHILKTAKTTMDPETRLAFVHNLMLLRSKNLVTPEVTLPLFFDLLLLRDKELRKTILSHIVGDIRKVNMPGHKNGASVNKQIQNYLFSVVKDDDPIQARRAELVVIDLYRRRVWCDARTVEVLTTCCYSKHAPIVRTALRFFLMQMPKVSSVDDTDEDIEEKDPGRDISKLKQKLKIKKKTRKRERILDREVKSSVRRYNKEEREAEAMAKASVDPVRLLRDPQQFAEQLYGKLQRTSERFEIRILYLSVIARVVNEHQVVILSLYSFLERYMEPSQLHATQLLALSSACVHNMVPPDAIEPLIRAIANHFVSDRSEPDSITIGINTIREICKRQPLAMNATLLADLVEYKGQRGDRGVMMAARALIQLYRDVYPDLLPAKFRGASASAVARIAARAAGTIGAGGAVPVNNVPQFGAAKPLAAIPGMELLLEYYNKRAADQGTSSVGGGDQSTLAGDYDDGMDSEDSDDDSDDSSMSSFETESEAFFSSATTEEDEADKLALMDDEPPMLVPVGTGKGAAAKNTAATAAKNTPTAASKKAPAAKKGGKASKADEEDDDDDEAVYSESDEEDDVWVTDDDEEDDEADDDDNEAGDEMDDDDDDDDDDEEDDDDDDEDWDEEDSEEDEEDEEETEATKEMRPPAKKKSRAEEVTTAAAAATSKAAKLVAAPSSSKSKSQPRKESSVSGASAIGSAVGSADDMPHWMREDVNPLIAEHSRAGSAFSAATNLSKKTLERVRNASTMSDAASVATQSGQALGSVTLFTDEDFARMKKLQLNSVFGTMMNKARDTRMRKKEDFVHGISTDLSAVDLEAFTERKKATDREERIAKTIELRKAKQPFNMTKKKKSKQNATHTEHNKRGKLFQMTKHSRRVGQKLKSSAFERGERDKENKKKNIKFRINRGWKA